MQQIWYACHIYPLETPNLLLSRAVRPFIDQFIRPDKGRRAFFIRYEDDKGPHIRLRMRGSSDWVNETLRPAFEGWFAGRGECVEQPYEPEIERFGGPEAMVWAEEHFHFSTEAVLDRLQNPVYTYGDAMFDALRLHMTTAHAIGLNREAARRYFSSLCDRWIPLFFTPEDGDMSEAARAELLEAFETQARRQGDALKSALENVWDALEDGRWDAGQPMWERWHKANRLIADKMEARLTRALPSLIHLTNNRLGINNQDEAYLNYLLGEKRFM